MQRRKFIKNLTYGGAAGIALGGIPVNLLGGNGGLKALAAASDNENVLIFIQLHGGNDALNTLIPVSQYHNYYELRSNIAIPDIGTRSYINVDQSVDENIQVGLHPDMLSFKQMYDDGKVAIVQNVGYPDMNLSHFRGRDIVFMGGDATSDYNSGWMGRFLDNTYPGYPDAYPNDDMPDPIGIELSGTLSLAFHRENGIPIGLNLGNPEQFYELISSVGVDPPITLPDSHAGDELRYIMEFEKKSNQYAGRLRDVYNAGSNSSVEYPEAYPFATPGSYSKNPLSGQLKLISRMIKGGIKTKIFLCRIGGFDTHGEQVEQYDSTLGHHASLLYHLSSAVKAFYDDLANLGIDQKVLAITFTEFGRRAYSNASYGTDHGTSTPVFIFGKGLNSGIYGENPDLSAEGLHRGNLQYNIDYRQIYTSIVQDWFGASDESLIKTGCIYLPVVNIILKISPVESLSTQVGILAV
ncbi:MAG TPA: DUF1501 domain-containing protein, partial [Bacteroides sp.]|nr:DUF1501 domain-containing protein [Bacteroides sp.]